MIPVCPHGFEPGIYDDTETGIHPDTGLTHCCGAETTFVGDSLVPSCRCCWTDATWRGQPLIIEED